MSSELAATANTGVTLYAIVINNTGKVYNGSVFETLVSANWATYAIAMVEQGGTGIFIGDFPPVVGGDYRYAIYQAVSTTPAIHDAIITTVTSLAWSSAAPVTPYASWTTASNVYARIGAGGAGLTALGDTRIGNLDATISSRHPSGAAVISVSTPVTVDAGSKTGVTLTTAYDAAKSAALATQIPANFNQVGISTAGAFSAAALAAAPVNAINAAAVATAVFQAVMTTTDFTTAGSFGAAVVGSLSVNGASVATVADKAGYLLAATGLDLVHAAPGVPITNAIGRIAATTASISTGAGTTTAVFNQIGVAAGTSIALVEAYIANNGNREQVLYHDTVPLPQN